MSTRRPYHYGHLLQVWKESRQSLYIAPGQGLTTPWRRKFDVNRNILSLRTFVASFKKISLKSGFIHFFHDFIYVYSPRTGTDSPQRTKFWCQQKWLVTSLICCKFQKISLKFFIHFFHDLIHVYSPGAGADSPRGQNFDVNRKALSLYPFVASFKEISSKSYFIQFLSRFNTCI